MAHLATGSLALQLESLFDGSSVVGMTGRQLMRKLAGRCRTWRRLWIGRY